MLQDQKLNLNIGSVLHQYPLCYDTTLSELEWPVCHPLTDTPHKQAPSEGIMVHVIET